MRIVILGSINLDLTTTVPRLPAPGETLLGSSVRLLAGGKGFNQAVAAGRLGAPAAFIGRVGADLFGGALLDLAAVEPVDLSGVAVDRELGTGLAVISVDEQAENTIIVVSGANMALDGGEVARCRQALAADGRGGLLLQLETPLAASLAAAREARARAVPVILDPAPARPLPPEVYGQVDLLTPNEVETEQLVGIRPADPVQAKRAAMRLRQRGVPAAVIKMGVRGVYFQADGGDGFIPPFPVKSVDSVAAGDAFNGALAMALAEGRPLDEAVRWGAAAGALATTRPGASAAMPDREALLDLLAGFSI